MGGEKGGGGEVSWLSNCIAGAKFGVSALEGRRSVRRSFCR